MSDDICDYLNITTTKKFDSNNLTAKFAVLDSSKNLTFFEWIFTSIIHQLIVAKCSYKFKVAQVAFQHSPESDDYYNNHLIYIEKLGYFSEIVPWIVLPNVFTPVSIIFNISLIVVTFATLKEHKVCNWLIAYDSLCQLFVVAPFGVNLLAVLFQISPLDYRICLGTLMASTVASYASILAIYLISIERLLIILYPIKMNWHKKSTVRRCSLIAVILCTLFGLIMNLNVFGIWTIINLPYDRFIYCNSGLYSDVLNTTTAYVILSLCVINYATIFGMILWRHFKTANGTTNQIQSISKNAEQSMRKMLRSVFLLLLVVLIGWLITSAARNQITDFFKFIIPLGVNCFESDPVAQGQISNNILSIVIGIITCVPILASASAAPILLLNSCEYGHAFKKLIKRKYLSVGPLFGN
uniref:G-protein coupled receptors family 1 profile domain-containing protein n=1 Tax=Globodera rostochiensis TaxID=31243 RepID=A0A914GSP0_GLORO